MAKLTQPDNFNFNKPAALLGGKQKFSRYHLTAKLHKDEEDVYTCIFALVYAMESYAEHVFENFISGQDDYNV